MSAISGYISQIQNAVYGEQVRGAIVSALEACYSDVESPSLNQAAFTAAIEAAYEGGILDIITVTQISAMTNQNIIYRYNGTEAGKQKGLYYYSALSSSWVLIGSEIQSVSLMSRMTDTNSLYKYTGTETGKQKGIYYHDGTDWVALASSNDVVSFSDVFTSSKNGLVPKPTLSTSGKYNITGYPDVSGLIISNTSVIIDYDANAWAGFSIGASDATFTFENGSLYIMVGRSPSSFLTIYTNPNDGNWDIYDLEQGSGSYTKLGTSVLTNMESILTTETHISISGNTLTVTQGTTTKTIDLSSYNDYNILLGFAFGSSSSFNGRSVTFHDGTIGGGDFEDSVLSVDGWKSIASFPSHWKGKSWYAYGTSLTNVSSEGKYATYLAQISGMILTNNGISGGSILGNIKSAIMNITDGKVNADLITIEVGANNFSTEIGTIYDTGDTTLCGALNQCIRYLQANTNAQIVVMSSTCGRYPPNSSSTPYTHDQQFNGHTVYDVYTAIREVCRVNGVYYIPMGDGIGMGLSRMQASNDYNVDQVHHTNLGGYNIAQGIWGYLKNIPLWYTSIPT